MLLEPTTQYRYYWIDRQGTVLGRWPFSQPWSWKYTRMAAIKKGRKIPDKVVYDQEMNKEKGTDASVPFLCCGWKFVAIPWWCLIQLSGKFYIYLKDLFVAEYPHIFNIIAYFGFNINKTNKMRTVAFSINISIDGYCDHTAFNPCVKSYLIILQKRWNVDLLFWRIAVPAHVSLERCCKRSIRHSKWKSVCENI